MFPKINKYSASSIRKEKAKVNLDQLEYIIL